MYSLFDNRNIYLTLIPIKYKLRLSTKIIQGNKTHKKYITSK